MAIGVRLKGVSLVVFAAGVVATWACKRTENDAKSNANSPPVDHTQLPAQEGTTRPDNDLVETGTFRIYGTGRTRTFSFQLQVSELETKGQAALYFDAKKTERYILVLTRNAENDELALQKRTGQDILLVAGTTCPRALGMPQKLSVQKDGTSLIASFGENCQLTTTVKDFSVGEYGVLIDSFATDVFNQVAFVDAASLVQETRKTRSEPLGLRPSGLGRNYVDVDGDHLHDICMLRPDGILCALGKEIGLAPARLWTEEFSDTKGWDHPSAYLTLRFVDIDGDGKTDACGRSKEGIRCALSTGDGFAKSTLWSASWADGSGFASAPYYESLTFVDLNADGRLDLCGRGDLGLLCSLSTGSKFAPQTLWSDFFRDANGWSEEKYRASLQFADLDGDNRADVCARGIDGVFCGLSTGTSISQPTLWSAFWSNANGFDQKQYYETIKLTDVNGDGRFDICGRGQGGVHCQLSEGSGFGEPSLWTTFFNDLADWGTDPSYWSSLQYVDVNVDGKMDVCGRSGHGIYCVLSTGESFQDARHYSATLSDAAGFSKHAHYQTVTLLEMSGDSLLDVCARLPSGLVCELSESTGESAAGVTGGQLLWTRDFSDADAKIPEIYYSTLNR